MLLRLLGAVEIVFRFAIVGAVGLWLALLPQTAVGLELRPLLLNWVVLRFSTGGRRQPGPLRHGRKDLSERSLERYGTRRRPPGYRSGEQWQPECRCCSKHLSALMWLCWLIGSRHDWICHSEAAWVTLDGCRPSET